VRHVWNLCLRISHSTLLVSYDTDPIFSIAVENLSEAHAHTNAYQGESKLETRGMSKLETRGRQTASGWARTI
jgi:hypothetical protein